MWKSEAEYKAYINRMSDGGEIKDSFSDCLQSFIEGDARGVQMPIVINPKLEEKLEREKEDAEQKLADAKNRIDRDSFSEQRNGTLRKLSLCRFLNRYAESGVASCVSGVILGCSFSGTVEARASFQALTYSRLKHIRGNSYERNYFSRRLSHAPLSINHGNVETITSNL